MKVDRDFYFHQLVQLGYLTNHVFNLGVTRLFIREWSDKNCCVRV